MLPIQNKIHIFTDTVSIRWRDVDPFGIVNHAVYFTLMEEVRWKWFETLNLKLNKLVVPIVEAHILFKTKIIYPAEIKINLYTGNFSDKSWVFYHEIFNANDPNETHAEATVKSITYDSVNKRVVSVPTELKESLHKQYKN